MSPQQFKNLKVGDQVFIVSENSRRNESRYVSVSKVGRKYVYLETSTYTTQQVQAWSHNGYAIAQSSDFPYCVVYASQEDYEAHQLWEKARSLLASYNAITGLSRDKRDEVVNILREELDL